jgi:hypothetical protein
MGQDDTPTTGRELLRESRSRTIVGKKNSPERLTKLLNYIVQFPQIKRACDMAGLSVTTLKYYLVKSEKGQPGDGFDLTYGDETKRFHLHFADCRDAAIQMVEDAYVSRAVNGYYETLSDKGRVIYQIDPVLAGLGVTGPDAYLLDADNKPIPERIEHQDPEVMEKVLRAYRRDRWGHHDKLDVNFRGGVMVVGMRAKDSKEIEELEKVRSAPLDVEFREVEDE